MNEICSMHQKRDMHDRFWLEYIRILLKWNSYKYGVNNGFN
jgi:hypothetical protein